MNSALKYIIIFTLILLISFGSFNRVNFYSPKKAEAFTWATFIQQIADYALQVYQYVKDYLAKIMRDVVAKQIIDYIVTETVKWIQGGGQPSFVSDWQGFLHNAANIAFDSVVKDTAAARLCQPFNLQVQLGLQPSRSFQNRLECTLDKVVGNVNSFYQNFQNGGWIAYGELWQPQNNYFGAMIMVNDELLQRTADKVNAANSKLMANAGFVGDSGKTGAEDYAKSDADLTPGSVQNQVVSRQLTSDTDWGANIESWVSALINAAISRLVKQGLSSMKATGGDNYTPGASANLSKQEMESQKNQLSELPRKILVDEQYILAKKQEAASSTAEIVATMERMQTQTCSQPITSAELQTAQNELNRINSDLAAEQGTVNELQNFLDNMNKAKTAQELMSYMSVYDTIVAKYGSNDYLENLFNRKEAADKEAQQKASDLASIKTRASNCTGGTATSTATSTP